MSKIEFFLWRHWFTRTLLGHHVARPSGNRPVGNQHYAYRYQTSLLRPDRLPLIQCPCHRNVPTESSEQWAWSCDCCQTQRSFPLALLGVSSLKVKVTVISWKWEFYLFISFSQILIANLRQLEFEFQIMHENVLRHVWTWHLVLS